MGGGYCSLPVPRVLTLTWRQVQGVHGVENEVDEMIVRHPVAEVGRE